MLSNIIESDTKALAKVFSNKEFYRPVDGNKKDYKTYLADIVSGDHVIELNKVVLPKEIIPNQVTSHVFVFAYRKDPLVLPILLKYFTHKNLLKEAKEDLNKVNQKLQDLMGEEIKKLKEEQKMARKEIAELSAKEVNVKQDEEVAKKGAKITETASRIEEIELYKEHVRNLLSGEKVISRTYPKEYYSILKDELTKIIEKKLKAYVKDDEAGVKKTYQSLNSKKERIKTIKRVYTISVITIVFSFAFFFLCPFYCHIIFGGPTVDQYFCYSLLAVPPAIIACAIAGIAFLIKIYCWKGFAKEIEDFIEGPKHVDKATNTENEKELEQTEKEQDVEDLIDLSDSGQLLTPSAPPLEEEVKERMYPIFDLQKELDSIEVTSFTLPNTDLTQKK